MFKRLIKAWTRMLKYQNTKFKLDTNDLITAIKKEAKTLTESIEKSIQIKSKEDKTLEYIYELTIINQYIELEMLKVNSKTD